MAQAIDVVYTVSGNTLTITPKKGSFSGNSLYQVNIASIQAADGTELGPFSAKEVTQITPLYCHIYDVRALIGELDIPDDQIIYYIRDASKYCDFINTTGTSSSSNYEVVQLTRYKAAKEAVLRYYALHSGRAGEKGMLGQISYEISSSTPDLKNLLKALNDEVTRWTDAVRGHTIEGRAKPQSAQRGVKGNALTTFGSYTSGIDRGGIGGF